LGKEIILTDKWKITENRLLTVLQMLKDLQTDGVADDSGGKWEMSDQSGFSTMAKPRLIPGVSPTGLLGTRMTSITLDRVLDSVLRHRADAVTIATGDRPRFYLDGKST
jgi:hypothetical protein